MERLIVSLGAGLAAFVVVLVVLALLVWLLGLFGVAVALNVYGIAAAAGVLFALYCLVTGFNPFTRTRL